MYKLSGFIVIITLLMATMSISSLIVNESVFALAETNLPNVSNPSDFCYMPPCPPGQYCIQSCQPLPHLK